MRSVRSVLLLAVVALGLISSAMGAQVLRGQGRAVAALADDDGASALARALPPLALPPPPRALRPLLPPHPGPRERMYLKRLLVGDPRHPRPPPTQRRPSFLLVVAACSAHRLVLNRRQPDPDARAG